MANKITTFRELAEAFGTLEEFGRVCGYDKSPGSRAQECITFGRLPVMRWAGVIEAARIRKIRGVDVELLYNLHLVKEPAVA